MLYKTIVLSLLEQLPQLHEQLCKNRQLLATLERLADELKSSHETWKEQLLQDQAGEREPDSERSAGDRPERNGGSL